MSGFINFFNTPTQGASKKPSVFNISTPKKVEAEVEENAEEIQEEAAKVEQEEVVAKQEEVPAEAPEEAVEAQSEEAPKKKRGGRKSTKTSEKTEEVSGEEEEKKEDKPVEFINAKFEPTKVKLNQIRKVFAVSLEDPEWEEEKAELIRRVNNIKVEENINTGSLRILLAQATNLMSDLLRIQKDFKQQHSTFVDSKLGLITRQMQLNAEGKNAEDRKKNSYLSCEHFKMKSNSGEYNLYDISMVLFDRLETVSGLIEDVKQKKEALIGYIAIMKLEAGEVK